MISETLPRLWEKNPETVKDGLQKLHLLTRGALAEMRTLLLELRPSSLIESDLGDLITQLASTLHAKTQITTDIKIHGKFPIPPDQKIALYRIAQEAINNIVKHSHATIVRISLKNIENGIQMKIADNGKGISDAQPVNGHMGLEIMRERAEKNGIQLEINRLVGYGTEIHAIWHGESVKEGI
jgi:signal transduction histidine kinase